VTDAAPERGGHAGERRQDRRPFAERVDENRTTRLAAIGGRDPGAGPGIDGEDGAAQPTETDTAGMTLVATATFGVTTLIALLLLALAPTVVLGWTATVIESSSMQPTVVRGDIVLLRPLEERAEVGAVVRFPADDGGTSIVHRVVDLDLEAGAYVTKGDANRNDDQALVPFGDVDGVGIALIPLIGHPALWFQEGSYLLLALMVLAGVGVILGGLGSDAKRSTDADDPIGPTNPDHRATPIGAVPILAGSPLGAWSTSPSGRRQSSPDPLGPTAGGGPGRGRPGSP